MKRLLTLLSVLALVAAACGDSDDSSSSDETTEARTTTEETTEATTTTEEELVVVEDVTDEEISAIVGNTQTADPLGDRGPEPSGTLDYAWHSSFSPKWFDPSQNTSSSSQFATQYILHDAVVKNMPGRNFAPSLAEEYTIADDFLSASFTLREGLMFHDGTPLTTKDVEFSYMNYSGANAAPLKDNLDSIEIVDERTIIFKFNKPFLDFLVLYGTTASGAGWVLPADYYQEVGPEGFIENPIGAGPFKFVANEDNLNVVYEANLDYWRKNPGVQTLNFRAIADPATRVAALKTGEIDLANIIPGDLLDAVRDDDNLVIQPITAVPFWIEFPGYEDPDSPFNDVRVREAVTLSLNREIINETETGGGGDVVGQWIPYGFEGVVEVDSVDYDPERAKELLAEAGYADGFSVDQLTPLPNYFTLGERVIADLREIGIETSLNQMDRGAFLESINAGRDGTLTGIIINISGAGGDAAARIRNFATCDGPASRICDDFIDAEFAKYEASVDPDERKELLRAVQQYIIDQHLLPYVYTIGQNMAQGPDVVQDSSDLWGQMPQYPYPGLWEDITVK